MMNDDHNYNYNDNQNFQITMNSQLLQISKQKGSKFELIPFATKAWTLNELDNRYTQHTVRFRWSYK